MSKVSKILVVFDLNCVLGYRQQSKLIIQELPGVSSTNLERNEILLQPHLVEKGYSLFFRPNSEILLNRLFVNKKHYFDVGIWANQTREETNVQVNQFLRLLRHNLRFVLYTNSSKVEHKQENFFNSTEVRLEEDDDISNSFSKLDERDCLVPRPIDRDLNIIFDKNPEFTVENTIIISNYENRIKKFAQNDIVIPLFHPVFNQTSFTRDTTLYFLSEYLNLILNLYDQKKGKH